MSEMDDLAREIPVEFRVMQLLDRMAYTGDQSDYSITTLIDSPQVAKLKKKHTSALTEPIEERLAALIGTAVHNMLTKACLGLKDVEVAKRFSATMLGSTVSGECDKITLLPSGGYKITDWKVVRAKSMKFDSGVKLAWVQQLNCYAALARLNGLKVEELEVITIIKDWAKSDLVTSATYPKLPILRHPVNVWSDKESCDYLVERVRTHQVEDLKDCTEEERWARKPVHAVHEKLAGGSGYKKRATRLFPTSAEAEAFILERGLKASIQFREGRSIRCEGNYCGVSEFCEQFKRLSQANEESDDDGFDTLF